MTENNKQITLLFEYSAFKLQTNGFSANELPTNGFSAIEFPTNGI
jgi:hypothetical protein